MRTRIAIRLALILGSLSLLLWLAGVLWFIDQGAAGTTPYLKGKPHGPIPFDTTSDTTQSATRRNG
jgi:hypothetical protein